jgi:hypothetical protein
VPVTDRKSEDLSRGPPTLTCVAQCSTYQYYQIVNAIFNISTDILILAVGIPPILRARLSLQQKLALGVVFGMGAFVIVAAVLRAIYCLVPSLISYIYMNWYFREATVAVYVTNLPGIWVLLRDIFPKLQKMSSNKRTNGHASKQSGQKDYGQISGEHWRAKPTGRSRAESKDFDFDMDTIPITSSKQRITTVEVELGNVTSDGSSTSSGRYNQGEIRRDVTFTVERVPMSPARKN